MLPVVLPAARPVPVWLGGEPVGLPERMPSGLPPAVARQLAAVLADQQPWAGARRSGRSQGQGAQRVAAVVVGCEAELVVDTVECDRLLRFLEAVPDRRKRRGRQHRLAYVLAVAVLAMMAGEPTLAGMGEWVATAPAALLVALGAQTDRCGRPRRPDRTMIGRALAAGGDELDQALCAWVGAIRRTHGGGTRYRSLHVDGKAVKNAGQPGQRSPMLLSARADDGTVAAQLTIEGKTNEIPRFAPLCDRIDDLTDTVITADQLHTQRAHATYLRHRGAHYVFTVGENQPKLYAALDALPWQAIAIEEATVDRGHGRLEVRTIKTLPATELIRGLFPHVEQAFLLERYVYTPDGTPLGAVAVLGITSLPTNHADAAAIATYVRGHWSAESLHWLRDVTLGEDDSPIKSAYQAMAALRNLIIGICSLNGIRNLARQLRTNHRDPYRLPLLLLGLMKPNPHHPATQT
ncbi:MAG TPA: ISAs1 family transposase [Micromonosporaceae bacterium]|nr:ISAs1 family transposase [Micromonosporaceae bacterium]